jgi:branched-chain amino acid transport system substrate-binding protein
MRSKVRLSRRAFLKALGIGASVITFSRALGWGQQPPIKVGLIGPINLLDVGRAMVRGAQLALDEINGLVNEGKLPPPKLTMDGLIRDDEVLRGDVAKAAFENLVSLGAVAIVGGFVDETVAAMLPSMARLRTPYLDTGSSSPEFNKLVKEKYDQYKYYFRVMINDNVMGQDIGNMAAGLMLKDMGIEKVALVAESSAFGQNLSRILQGQLAQAGLQLVKVFSFSLQNPDFASILQQVSDTDADAMMLVLAFDPGIALVGQAYEMKLDMPVIGINAEGQSFEYWKNTGGRVMGHVYVDVATGETPITPKTRPFYQAYVERFGDSAPSRPLFTAFTTYDALFILKGAIDRAGGTDPDKIVAALEQTDYVGTVGRIKFRDRNDPYPHEPIYDPEYVVAKWVVWGTTAKNPLDPKAQPVRVVVWPPKFRLKADPEGNPVSIADCIGKACEEYRKSVAAWKQQGRPKGGRFAAWHNWARAIAQCFAG